MSLALYRKYRPATFAELKGQEHVAEPLQQALRNGRINHAYLFSGPRGCGKTSSARILARSLNCEKGPTPDPCGTCDSCVDLGPAGTGHIDVIEIDAASHGGVDDARDLRERAFFAPVSARFKVYIIDEAHMVTREGFNALLKLVEEPPPHLKFVFATTEPEKVIGTIRSRTHHYPFRLIPPGVLQDLVEEILRAEDVPYETAALPLAVRAGAGSARDTLSILDQLLAGSDEEGITYARAVSLLGYTDSALLDEVIAAFAGRDGGAVFAAIDRVIGSGQDPRRFTADLLERVRDLVILSNVPEAGGTGLLKVPPDELEQMRRQAGSLGPGELTRTADLLHTGLTEMRGATSPRLLLELICARVLLPAAYEDEASMFARLDRLERQVAQGGQVAQQGGQGVRGVQGGRASMGAYASGAQGQGFQKPEEQPSRSLGPEGQGAAMSNPPTNTPAMQPPPAQGGDPTSIVNRPGGAGEAEPSSVDNRAAGGTDGGSAGSAAGGPVSDAGAAGSVGAAGGGAGSGQSAASTGGMDVATVQRFWPDIVEAVKLKSRVAWMAIMSGVQPISLEYNLLTLSFEAEGARTNFTNGGRDVVLREVLQERMGVDWRIDTVLGGAASGTSGTSGSSGGRPGRSGGRPGGRPNGPPGGGGPAGGPARGPAGSPSGRPTEDPERGPEAGGPMGASTGGSLDGPPGGPPGGPAGGPAGGGGPGAAGGHPNPSSPSAGFAGASAPTVPHPAGGAARSSAHPEPPDAPTGATGPAGAHGSSFSPGTAAAGQAFAGQAFAGQGGGERPGSARRDLGPPPPDGPPLPPEPSPMDEREEVDPEGDADADGTEAEASGMALIQRELGGQIIREIDNS